MIGGLGTERSKGGLTILLFFPLPPETGVMSVDDVMIFVKKATFQMWFD